MAWLKAEPEGKRMIISKIKSVLISKRMLYTLCFFFLMVIDWTRGSQVGSTWAWTVNMTGVVMAIILFSAYDFKTFLKPVYLVYSAACVIVWRLQLCAIGAGYTGGTGKHTEII